MAKDEAALLEMGLRIAQLRKEVGLGQQEIADYCGVDKRTYQFWQAGDTEPEPENLRNLAKVLKTTPKYILRGDTPEPASPRSEQLDRIERKLDELLERLPATPAEPPADEDLPPGPDFAPDTTDPTEAPSEEAPDEQENPPEEDDRDAA